MKTSKETVGRAQISNFKYHRGEPQKNGVNTFVRISGAKVTALMPKGGEAKRKEAKGISRRAKTQKKRGYNQHAHESSDANCEEQPKIAKDR